MINRLLLVTGLLAGFFISGWAFAQGLTGAKPPFRLDQLVPEASHTFLCNPSGSLAPLQPCTFGGNFSFTGTQVDVSGASPLTVTDGSTSVTGVTSILFPTGVAVSGTTGTATVSSTVVVDLQNGNTAFAIPSTEGGKSLLRTNTVSQTDTIADPATSGFGIGFGFDYTTGSVSNTIAVGGGKLIGGLTSLALQPHQYVGVFAGAANYRAALGVAVPSTQDGTLCYFNDFTWVACPKLSGNNTLSGNNILSGKTTVSGTVVGSHLDFSATGAITLGAACGKHVRYTGASAGTLTVNAAEVADCAFDVAATSTGLATIAASGGSFIANTACTANKRTKETGSVLWVKVDSNAGSAPVVIVSGDCG